MHEPKKSGNAGESGVGTESPRKKSKLTYNSYLKVPELKALQICQSEPAHHDEFLFIVIHQAYELWFRLILHEIDTVLMFMRENRPRRATVFMRRVNAVMKLLVQQIHILETMEPRDFLGFRYELSPASGFQSSQFREIEFSAGLKSKDLLGNFKEDPKATAELINRFEAPSLLDEFYAVLRRRGFSMPMPGPDATEEQKEQARHERLSQLLKLYRDDESYPDLHDLSEQFIEFDELLFFWRAHHVMVVERMIGYKMGTGGSEGVGYLRTTLEKRCFPDLWHVRSYLEDPTGAKYELPAGSGCPMGHS